MHIYKEGEKCPCCGTILHGMIDSELELFSQLCHVAGLEPLPEPELAPIDWQPEPDAGLNPPVKPVL